jgi:hypothetical protein
MPVSTGAKIVVAMIVAAVLLATRCSSRGMDSTMDELNEVSTNSTLNEHVIARATHESAVCLILAKPCCLLLVTCSLNVACYLLVELDLFVTAGLTLACLRCTAAFLYGKRGRAHSS